MVGDNPAVVNGFSVRSEARPSQPGHRGNDVSVAKRIAPRADPVTVYSGKSVDVAGRAEPLGVRVQPHGTHRPEAVRHHQQRRRAGPGRPVEPRADPVVT